MQTSTRILGVTESTKHAINGILATAVLATQFGHSAIRDGDNYLGSTANDGIGTKNKPVAVFGTEDTVDIIIGTLHTRQRGKGSKTGRHRRTKCLARSTDDADVYREKGRFKRGTPPGDIGAYCQYHLSGHKPAVALV